MDMTLVLQAGSMSEFTIIDGGYLNPLGNIYIKNSRKTTVRDVCTSISKNSGIVLTEQSKGDISLEPLVKVVAVREWHE